MSSVKLEDIVMAIPHAGWAIPDDIRPLVAHDDRSIRNESDLYTDRIYTIDGPRVVTCEHSRLISDPNRAPDEIYSEGVLRALGVVMLSFPEGHDVFEEDPTLEQMHSWIERFHTPFHDQLEKATQGAKFLLDCHSLWSVAAAGHYGSKGDERADIVLGNQYYCTCSAETTQFFRSFFEEKGYSVAINDPYPGRFILGTYCSRLGLPGIQIEINRKLYLDEETLDPKDPDIKRFNSEIAELAERFCVWFEGSAPAGEKPLTDLSEGVES